VGIIPASLTAVIGTVLILSPQAAPFTSTDTDLPHGLAVLAALAQALDEQRR
jgi:hypothetical protein